MPRLVVSLTTVPFRIKNLDFLLSELYQQSRKPDAIYLAIANKCRRNNAPYPEISKDIFTKYPNFKVVKLKQDYGAVCKILGGLLKEQDPETIIVSVDDDFEYLPNSLLANFEYHCIHIDDSCVWATRGKQIGTFPFMYGWSNWQRNVSFLNSRVKGNVLQIISGYNGVAYRRKFFPCTYTDWNEKFFIFGSSSSLIMHDDVWISAYLNSQNIISKQITNSEYYVNSIVVGGKSNGLSSQKIDFAKHYYKSISDAKKLNAFQGLSPIENVNTTATFGLVLFSLVTIGTIVALISRNNNNNKTKKTKKEQ